ncbi:MAG: pyruvate kinase [Chloroflexota bacterium]|nr:pyruvate kinase [Chloroflexota bacterium]
MTAERITRRRTKIVATIGPASVGRVDELVGAGMDVARLNFSHGTPADHEAAARAVREASARAGRPVAVMADLAGPKVRLGRLPPGGVVLTAGATFTLRRELAIGNTQGAATNHEGLEGDLQPGDRISLADGAVELRVTSIGDAVDCEVVTGGSLRSHAGVNVPASRLSLPAITDRDREDLVRARALGADYIAQSFVRQASDVDALRAELGEPMIPIIAKIETGAAVEAAADILHAADAVMLARGDLGVDVDLERVPLIQKRLTRQAVAMGVPAIIATHMLESMIDDPRPTRAEVSDVANAVLDDADAVMLSGETAIGRHPVAAVQTAARIVTETERHGDEFPTPALEPEPGDSAAAVARAAADVTAANSEIAAIACFTETGTTAELLAAARPRVPIAAFCADEAVARRLTLRRAVHPVLTHRMPDTDAVIGMLDAGLSRDFGLAPGTPVVLVAASPVGKASTNLLKLHRVGEWAAP